MSKEIDQKYVTPEYLLSHGFEKYISKSEGLINEIPFCEGDLHFKEIEHDRRMFVVTFSPNMDQKKYPGHFHHSIYVQEDAGCGFVCIPEPWWVLPIEYFESIYYGIRGEKPKYNATNFSNTGFEVIPDEPESPTLSRNLIDDAGLWGGDKLLTIKTKEG